MFYSVPVYNTFLNSFNITSRSSGGIFISSAFLEFASDTGFGLGIFSPILFPINSPFASAVL